MSEGWLEFNEGEWFNIHGRGNVFSTKNPFECKDFSHIFETFVIIKGNSYYVTGIEYFAIQLPYPKGHSIGLLVRGPIKEENNEQ